MEAMRRSARLFAITAGALGGVVLAASPASAHPGHAPTGFGSGFFHPITGPDHLLAMVAVGIVAATWRSDRSLWLAPATFLGAMVAGGIAGLAGVPLPGAEVMIAASVLLLGVAIAGALTDDGAWVLPALAIAGIAHGHAHGAEAPSAAHPALFIAGFVLATATLHVVGVGVGTVVRNRRAVRMSIGVATASAGALLLLAT